jgi:hypothetical protein
LSITSKKCICWMPPPSSYPTCQTPCAAIFNTVKKEVGTRAINVVSGNSGTSFHRSGDPMLSCFARFIAILSSSSTKPMQHRPIRYTGFGCAMASMAGNWRSGRSYGGGVLELEPSEAEQLPIPMRGAESIDFELIHNLLLKDQAEQALTITDKVLLRDGLGLSQKDASLLRGIWCKLRDRRINRKHRLPSSDGQTCRHQAR